jgi:hypothetical protein
MDKTYGKNKSGIWRNVRLKFRDDEDDDCLAKDTSDDDEVPDICLQEL